MHGEEERRRPLEQQRAQRRGTIVNIASGSGRRPTLEAGAPYSAAKAGLILLNSFINLEERKHGIRACTILVGKTDTPAHRQGPNPATPEMRATWLEPADVADAVVFVANLPDRATIEELVIRPTDTRFQFALERTIDGA